MELTVNGLSKAYKKKKALDNFNLSLSEGVYGLLGPNGAGKTTLINILVGLLKADTGQVLFDGVPTEKMGMQYIEKLGYLPQYPSFYKDFAADEFLLYMCALKGTEKSKRKGYVKELLATVNLHNDAKKKIGAFSGGMRQRLGIAQAIINDPAILILDEPTAGLDPKERMRFRNIISQLGTARIVILATHIVTDIEYISKEIILIKEGRLVKKAGTTELINDIQGNVWQLHIPVDAVLDIMNQFKVSSIVNDGEHCIARIVSSQKPSESAVLVTPSLEDVCLYHFGEV